MRRFLAFPAMFVLAVVATAQATPYVQLSHALIPGFNGGPFSVQLFVDAGATTPLGVPFNSFCVEEGEDFVAATTYEAVIADRARFGTGGTDGSDIFGTFDLLSSQTAWMYQQYRSGTLGAAVPSYTGSNDSLKALQNAIWNFEGETISGLTPSVQTIYNDLVTAAGAHAADGIGNVRVLQMWDVAFVNVPGHQHQDQLVLVGPSGGDVPTVPLPAAAWAGLSLLAGMMVYRIRQRREA